MNTNQIYNLRDLLGDVARGVGYVVDELVLVVNAQLHWPPLLQPSLEALALECRTAAAALQGASDKIRALIEKRPA